MPFFMVMFVSTLKKHCPYIFISRTLSLYDVARETCRKLRVKLILKELFLLIHILAPLTRGRCPEFVKG